MLTQIENNIELYGQKEIIDLINECMANSYKGIIFDKLKNKKNNINKSRTSAMDETLKEIYNGTIKLQ